VDQSFSLNKTHFFTRNPTWRQLDIPGSVFPLILKVLNEEGINLYESLLSSEEMFFICEQLEDLEPFNSTALLLEFNHEAFYTTSRHAEELTELAAGCGKLLKYQATFHAKEREIPFQEAKEKYLELFEHRKKLSDIASDIQKIKNELVNLFPNKKNHYLNSKRSKDLKAEIQKQQEIIEKQESLVMEYKKMIVEKTGQKKVYDELLKAHKKKKSERQEKCKKETMVLVSKERLLKARRLKMMCELINVFEGKIEFNRINQGNYENLDDEEIGFTLGYMAHAIDILNDIFKTPSIFVVKFFGSKSAVIYQGKETPLFYVPGSRDLSAIDFLKADFKRLFNYNTEKEMA
jgi:predicted transcriptional regulator